MSNKIRSPRRASLAARGIHRTVKPGPRAGGSFPVVGIGASAGGLAAIFALLEALPAEPGMAFVVISHLAPGSKSILGSLLAGKTRMPVHQAHEGEPVEPNQVYVAPPGKRLVMRGGALHLEPGATRGGPTAIDTFFASLASEKRGNARGVVLSGNGSDGTEGLRLIQREGGITFAQDPSTAQFDQMPANAIAAGCVNHVLSPAQIARQLLNPSPADTAAHSRRQAAADPYERIIATLPRITGIDFNQYKAGTLRRRIDMRMAQKGFADPADYLRHLRSHADEPRKLFSDLLIHVSSFFRDPEAFRVLGRKVIAPLLNKVDPRKPIRVWVAGCARGEEVYSIGMLLLEQAARLKHAPQIQLFGTDVSAPDIDAARTGRFGQQIAADVSASRLKRFFDKVPGGYQVRSELRELCVFACHEIGSDPPFSNLDLVSCRNLLIYFARPLQQRVIETFHYALKPGGALFLGRSESLGGHPELFTALDRKCRIYRSKPALPGRAVPGGPPGRISAPPLPHVPPRVAAPSTPHSMERALLDLYAPPGLYVDEDLVIRAFVGDVSPYLQPAAGQANLQLGRMLPAGVALDVRTALRAARKSARPVRRQITWLAPDGSSREVVLVLMRVAEPDGRRCYLVMFEQAAAPEPANAQPRKPPRQSQRNELARMSKQLAATREQLQTVLEEQEGSAEELRSAHEEALSGNEELQSSNEELQTAKEELQSANEELATVNEELMERNQQLDHLVSELNTLLAGINIPIVHLDREGHVRRYSPAAHRMFNLIASDIGRPLSQITPSLPLPELDGLVAAARARGVAAEREVQDQHGRWYSLRVRPFSISGGRSDGALIALVDIDATKRSITGIVETMNEPLLVLDRQFRVMAANPAYCKVFRTTQKETLESSLFELGNRQWDVPELHRLLEEVLPKRRQFQNFRVEHESAVDGPRAFRLAGKQIVDAGIGVQKILLMFQDVTGAEDSAQRLNRILEEEEKHIAHELHDLSGGSMASLSIELAQLSKHAVSAAVARRIRATQQKMQQLSASTHDLARRIHPSVVEDLGLRKALRGECRAVEELHGIKVSLRAGKTIDRLPGPVSLCVYRVVQEALRNVRHSKAQTVTIAVDAGTRVVRLKLRDNGVGFDVDAPQAEGRMGLLGMSDRVAALGGTFGIESTPGKGATISAEIPLTADKVKRRIRPAVGKRVR
ncbi:chemotaxis protein CheB [Nevskia soli]|uniref:chemotaxis protein CheB n=1 Tax=Nevskia soli TaxID=418856 RepID=UPI0009FF412C|nr:chemotaxis protein CheB [Nevskia soli]